MAAAGDDLLALFDVPVNPLLEHLTSPTVLVVILRERLEALKKASPEEKQTFKLECEAAKTQASNDRQYEAIKLLGDAIRELDNQSKAQTLSNRLALLYAAPVPAGSVASPGPTA